jgi:Zn-dependent M28 family amino/carboxypeptidase
VRVLLFAALIACHARPSARVDAPPPPDAPPDAAQDRWLEIYNDVDGAHLMQLLADMSSERYTDAGRQRFRDYWTQYMTGLGLTVTQLPYQAPNHPRPGMDVEAVLPGASADSVIVIVHYDSMGPIGAEASNPAADDDMSGMAVMLETARILVAHQRELAYTVRFVATDEEELGGLAGARYYATHIKAASQAGGFQLVAAVDDEQIGWDCHADGLCQDNVWPAFDVFSCGKGSTGSYDFPAIGDRMQAIASAYSPLTVVRGCLGENSDHYAMWEIGVPAVVYSEHSVLSNPHFDFEGGDTLDKIAGDYLTSIARPAITFQAALVGIQK